MFLKKDALLVADLQGFIRIIAPDHTLLHAPWPEKEEHLRLVDVLKTDAVEAESLTGESDIKKAAMALIKPGKEITEGYLEVVFLILIPVQIGLFLPFFPTRTRARSEKQAQTAMF